MSARYMEKRPGLLPTLTSFVMPEEYVVALHDFTPEHDDEIEFKAGDLIFVVEKDDQYQDGWWQGRNPAGKTGLFPQSYTKVHDPLAPPTINGEEVPHISTTLDPLAEEEENPGPSNSSRSPSLKPQPENVMHATLTDVQAAIEQLAVRRDTDTDAGRSFSFASTREDTDAETEEEGDHDTHHSPGDAQEFRKTLAERAEMVNARKAKEQAEADPVSGALDFLRRKSSSNIVIPPPIDVELSDESDADDEDEDEQAVKKRHEHDIHPIHHKYTGSTSTARISESETTNHTPRAPSPLPLPTQTTPTPPEVTVVAPPPIAAPTPQTPTTATTGGFPLSQESSPGQPRVQQPSHAAELAASISSPPPTASPANVPLPKSPSPVGGAPNGASWNQWNEAPQAVAVVVPEQPLQVPQPQASTPSPAPVPVAAAQVQTPVTAGSSSDAQSSLKSTHPSEWTVDQVVEWLKSKGVDDATCAKFVEHEISGDVLLELDVSILKEEMGITAFGKRMRIANAIVELKRPASFSSEPQLSQNAAPFSPRTGTGCMGMQMGMGMGSNGHMGQQGSNGMEYPYSYPPSGATSPGMGMSMNGKRYEESVSVISGGGGDDGLKVPKSRPAQLALSSPSEGALHTNVQPTQILEAEEESPNGAGGDDRAVQSENETPLSSSTFPSRRRRFLGLSTESGSSRGSKDRKSSDNTSIPNSPALRGDKSPSLRASASMEDGSINTAGSRHQRGKKSIDTAAGVAGQVGSLGASSKGSERLSFFGATLGKGRKPPPRYSVYDDSALPVTTDKAPRTISRFMGGGGKKTGRPSTGSSSIIPFGSKESSKEDTQASLRDPALLRKRHISTSGPISPPMPIGTTRPPAKESSGPVSASVNGPNEFVPGQSVLDQIGEPDHAGWLRKKGERYNTWKLRYLVLKGPHLYYLRSNSRTETKIKGYIPVHGYKVIVDENLNPGKYGFSIVHETAPPHYFSSDEQITVREWMKALMKSTIDRDYSKPVVSSCNIPTIPLTVAQAMNPAPRPPSPTQRDATQKALRRENPNQLSSRDARVLMGLPGSGENGSGANQNPVYTYNVENTGETSPMSPTPPRPSRIARAPSVNNGSNGRNGAGSGSGQQHTRGSGSVDRVDSITDSEILDWANWMLPETYRIHDIRTDLTNGLVLLRLAESIKGRPSDPPVPDSLFRDENNIEGMFKLFDYLLDNDVKVGGVSINDIKQGRVDKTIQLLKSLRAWSEKRKAVARSIGKPPGSAGPWMAMETGTVNW